MSGKNFTLCFRLCILAIIIFLLAIFTYKFNLSEPTKTDNIVNSSNAKTPSDHLVEGLEQIAVHLSKVKKGLSSDLRERLQTVLEQTLKQFNSYDMELITPKLAFNELKRWESIKAHVKQIESILYIKSFSHDLHEKSQKLPPSLLNQATEESSQILQQEREAWTLSCPEKTYPPSSKKYRHSELFLRSKASIGSILVDRHNTSTFSDWQNVSLTDMPRSAQLQCLTYSPQLGVEENILDQYCKLQKLSTQLGANIKSKNRIMIYPYRMGYTGIGSQFHTISHCLNAAFKSQRQLMIVGKWEFAESFGLSNECPQEDLCCYFSSIRCSNDATVLKNLKDGKIKDLDMSNPLAQEEEMVTCPYNWPHVMIVPKEVLKSIPHLGYWSLVYKYFMQPTERLLDRIVHTKLAMGLIPATKFITLHVRHGSKGLETATFQLAQYIPHLEKMSSLLKTRKVFLSTEDPQVINETLNYPSFQWVYTESERDNKDIPFNREAKINRYKRTMSDLINLLVSADGSGLICTFSSNWCRMLYLVVMAKQGHSVPVISLDHVFGDQLIYSGPPQNPCCNIITYCHSLSPPLESFSSLNPEN